MIININDGRLSKRRNHNSMAIAIWVLRGYIKPRKEANLNGKLLILCKYVN